MRVDLIAGAALVALASAASALACGFCIEDRVAAVYDAAAVEGALKARRHIAFFELEGPIKADAATRNAVASALDSSGAVRGSARISLENAACAVAYDPAKTTLARLTSAASRALATRGLALKALRIIDAGGKLREP